MNRTKLIQAITTIIEESQRATPDQFEDGLTAVEDHLTTGKEGDDLYLGSIVDGIRWGVQTGVNVDLSGGAILRVCLPDGVRITHEWEDAADADQAIKDALAAIESARVTAQKARDD